MVVSNMFIFIPKIGEDVQFDYYLSGGLEPPSKYNLKAFAGQWFDV